ncbi:MAG: hypothetical protein IT373_13585 [Polyangiaceae bacterium]|nr:hypothetical protein [Polyangiaceae bacterium]
MKSVRVEGERVELCVGHARALALGTPATRALLDAAVAALPERRRVADRRAGDDRRTFPRPEGRRMSDGRRATDA